MDSARTFSKRSFFWIFLVMILFALVVDVAIYFGTSMVGLKAVHDAADPTIMSAFAFVLDHFPQVVVPASGGLALLFTLILWGIMKGLYAKTGAASVEADSQPLEAVDPEVERRTTQRTFLHIVSALQKEGRLIDFFNEDLSLYDDDQIGAAVRGIHENCVKTLDKYVSCGPVVDTPEGETMTVEAGFNPEEIRLTGNVAGDPPFVGTVRHKGWRAIRTDVPLLSPESNPDVLAPAEVELS